MQLPFKICEFVVYDCKVNVTELRSGAPNRGGRLGGS